MTYLRIAEVHDSVLRSKPDEQHGDDATKHDASTQHSNLKHDLHISTDLTLNKSCFTNLEPHVKQHLADDVEGFCEKIDDTGNGVPDDSHTVV